MTIDDYRQIQVDKTWRSLFALKGGHFEFENWSSGIPSLFASGDAIMSSLRDLAQESLAEGCL